MVKTMQYNFINLQEPDIYVLQCHCAVQSATASNYSGHLFSRTVQDNNTIHTVNADHFLPNSGLGSIRMRVSIKLMRR